jgi:hypothetical protein
VNSRHCISKTSIRLLREAAAALREASHSSVEKRDNPITVTDAQVEAGSFAICKAIRTRFGGIPDDANTLVLARVAIEAALNERSEE